LSTELGLTEAEITFVTKLGRPLLLDLAKEAPGCVKAALEFLMTAQSSHWICAFKVRVLRALKRIPFSTEERHHLQRMAPDLWNDYPSAQCKEVNVELRRALVVVADAAYVEALLEWSRRGGETVQRESRRVLEILEHRRPELFESS
jgi:hypothetical protein